MTELAHLDLIRFLDFYLMLTFVAGTVRRVGQYLSVGRLAVSVPSRWPRLLDLARQHRMIFLTWATVLPALLWLMLPMAQLVELWPAVPVLLLTGGAMLGVDVYATFSVGAIDRPMLEKYFDQAEYWLRSWAAPVVKVFTFGYVNPRRMVAAEVQKALVQASELLNSTLWWVSVQIALRTAFGLSLWLAWAVTKGV